MFAIAIVKCEYRKVIFKRENFNVKNPFKIVNNDVFLVFFRLLWLRNEKEWIKHFGQKVIISLFVITFFFYHFKLSNYEIMFLLYYYYTYIRILWWGNLKKKQILKFFLMMWIKNIEWMKKYAKRCSKIRKKCNLDFRTIYF